MRADELHPSVLAFGGGIIENETAMGYLREKGIFIYLKEDAGTLFKRIEAGGIPPFLSPENPFESFLELYERRTALYHGQADMTVSVHGKTQEEASRLIASTVAESFHSEETS
jgi:shikimate kinase